MLDINAHLEATVAFLVDLLNIHSPTGYTQEAVGFVQERLEALALPGLRLERTPKGALLAHWPGAAKDAPRGLTAHLDTLGLMVREIKASGRLQVHALNGILWPSVETEGVTVRTLDDRRIRGSLLLNNPSVHVNREAATMPRNADTMEVRLDARTRSAAETRALGVQVGDFVFVDPRVEMGEAGFIRGRFLDDKAGVAAIYGALLALGAAGLTPAQDTTILIANYEEVGHGGSDLPRELAELVAVDMGAIGVGQNSDEFTVSICVKDGSGAYHDGLTTRLRRLADAHEIPYHPDIYPYYSSDGSAYWRAGGSGAVALVGPGIDASHGYERTHRESIGHSAHPLAQYLVG